MMPPHTVEVKSVAPQGQKESLAQQIVPVERAAVAEVVTINHDVT